MACSGGDSYTPADISGMTLREKVSSMFFVRPEALDPSLEYSGNDDLVAIGLQEMTPVMRETAAEYPVGGVVLFAHNIGAPDALGKLVADVHTLPGSPLLCIDEEGGRVARLANNPVYGLPRYESMTALAAGGKRAVTQAAGTIGSYLKEYGFDVDFAPVADVNTNPDNIVIGPRAFSDNPRVAAKMVVAYLKTLQKAGVTGCIKHFPGHGDTSADTHFGYAVSHKTREELGRCELIPFRAGIRAGARMVMTAHISVPAVTGSDIPSTLSPEVLQGILREELGFRGVIVTDAMEMGAIVREYNVADACVLAVKAGVDVLLCVKDYRAAVDAIVAAVENGDIPESRIDESVKRICALKQ